MVNFVLNSFLFLSLSVSRVKRSGYSSLRRLRQFSIPIEGASCSFSLIIELHVLKNKVPSSTMIRMSIVQSSEEDVPYLNAFSTNVIKIIGGIFTLS